MHRLFMCMDKGLKLDVNKMGLDWEKALLQGERGGLLSADGVATKVSHPRRLIYHYPVLEHGRVKRECPTGAPQTDNESASKIISL